jgi:hypothetical protein
LTDISSIQLRMDIPLGSFDRFIVYKTWKHDDSVIYHLATWTNITAYFTNLLFPSCKVTVIFLKVQLPEYPDAFNALGDEGVELSDNVKYGLDDDIGTELKQKIEMWNSVSSADIKQFCDKHIDQVEVGIQEAGYFRIVTVVWEPEKGSLPRIAGMHKFIENNWIWKKESEAEEVLRMPFRFITNAALVGGAET